MTKIAMLGVALMLAGCGRQKVVEARVEPTSHENPTPPHQVRATAKVRAVRSHAVQVPQITGHQGGQLTLTKLIANGAEVHEGDIVAEFDRTTPLFADGLGTRALCEHDPERIKPRVEPLDPIQVQVEQLAR